MAYQPDARRAAAYGTLKTTVGAGLAWVPECRHPPREPVGALSAET